MESSKPPTPLKEKFLNDRLFKTYEVLETS